MIELENTYDCIVIGAGHHGMILASYLAKSGLKVVLLERRLLYGGGLVTSEVTQPGYYHNLHSINHFEISNAPGYKDLELKKRVNGPRPPARPRDCAGRRASRPASHPPSAPRSRRASATARS